MRIMIVDDSKTMRMIIRRTLRQAGFDGHEVEEATNGREALEAIVASPPDVVLTDWNMPEMSGIELVRALRDRGVSVTIGFVTSQGTLEMQQEAESAGASFMITKPFTTETFRDALEGVLS